MRLMAPMSLILTCWGATMAIAGLTLANLDNFDLVALFMQREGLELSAFTSMGAAWIALSLLVFFAGDLAARVGEKPPHSITSPIDIERAAIVTFAVNLALLSITLTWIMISAAQLGGLVNLASLAYLDSLGARDLLLGNKLFTGMRLFYAALPATGCFAAGILACAGATLSRRARILCVITLGLNAIALFILPLVMSQRLLLLQFLLAAYLVTCLIRGRIVGLGWLGLAAVLFFATWVMRESITNPLIERSAIDIGTQKLAFYFVNDLWNGFAPLQADIPHTFGGVSLRGFLFLTFTDGMFEQILRPKMNALDTVLGGGDFPFFTAAYVDFGPFFGALFIGLCAFIFRILFRKAHQSVVWTCIYAQVGAALLFSTHGIYFTHQNFLASIGTLLLVGGLSRHTGQAKSARIGLLNA